MIITSPHHRTLADPGTPGECLRPIETRGKTHLARLRERPRNFEGGLFRHFLVRRQAAWLPSCTIDDRENLVDRWSRITIVGVQPSNMELNGNRLGLTLCRVSGWGLPRFGVFCFGLPLFHGVECREDS